MRRFLPLLLVLGCTTAQPLPPVVVGPAPGPARAQRVVVVSVDGLRPDAIEKAGAEHLLKLIARGAYCAKAQTVRPSITHTSHASMLTGLDPKRHGVLWNRYRPGTIPHPTVFSVASGAGMGCAMYFAKDKFHYFADPKHVAWIYGPAPPEEVPEVGTEDEPILATETSSSADRIGGAFAAAWPVRKAALTFVHLREVDSAGHRKGWMGPEYLAAVKFVDEAVGQIVAAIEQDGGFAGTALIVTSDHGGLGRSHYWPFEPDKPEIVTIPWICVGPGVAAGLSIDRVVRITDTAPTALAFLGLGAPEGIEGKLVAEVLGR